MPADRKRKAADPEAGAAGGELAGKVLLVTGGAQGLGLAIATMAAARGAAHVVIADRQKGKKKSVEAAVIAAGASSCLFAVCDAADPEHIRLAVEAADRRYGRIDGLVNCVGDTRRGTLEDTSVEQFDAQIAVNLRAPFLFTQHVSKIMCREGTRGSIVNIASVQSRGGLTFCMAYAAAKAALVCLTRNNAMALAAHRIRVNAVNMGWCVTDGEHELQLAESGDPAWAERADRESLLGRITRPADIAHCVCFLLADGAFTTGSVMDVHPECIPGMLGGAIGKAAGADE